VEVLARDYAWAVDLQICVFPQEGLLDNPGTEALLVEGLRRGARVLGGAPYCDADPAGQIDRIFAIARDFNVDIDLHLDMGDSPAGMQADHVCRVTAAYGMAGRVSIGHATQMSFLPPAEFVAGISVAVLPATDLFLTGRSFDHAVPRGVAPVDALRRAGCRCSVASNNVLNPFTPYGDGSLVRMANLAANVAQIGRPADLAACLDMITGEAAAAIGFSDYGVAVGHTADLVAFDASDAAGVVAEVAPALWGMRAGRRSFTRPQAVLHRMDQNR